MSHSAGFEERTLGVFVPTTDDLVPLSQWLPANLPARVRPPGTVSSYSNYGAALAGHVVERVSGLPYEDYIEAYLLQPPGMKHTTARQPLPPGLAPGLSLGYAAVDGALVAQPFEVLQAAPGGSMSATVTDIAAFMIAHLQNGRYGDARILAEDTARQMHTTSFQHDPRLHGYAHGFEEHVRNGQRLLSHGGEFQYFRSRLDLLPDSGVGLFVAYNSAMARDLSGELLQAFLDRYYPASPTVASPPPDFAARAAPFTGQYRSNRHAYTTAEKVLLVLQPVFTIRADENLLVLSNPYRRQEQRFVEVEPLLFQQVDGQDRLAFHQDGARRVDLAFLESNPAIALERVAWYEGAVFNQLLLGLILLLFLSLPVVGLMALMRRRGQLEVPGQAPAAARVARWTVVAIAGLSWLFLLGTAMAVGRLAASLGADPTAMRMLDGLMVLPLLIVVLTGASVALLVPVWRHNCWHLSGRIYHTLLVAAALGFTWFLLLWNLLVTG